MQSLAIIPARYQSSRLPGKPLADINGKPMVQHVYERVCQVFSEVVVATDDELIAQAVESFEGRVALTRSDHPTGTNRCLEVLEQWQKAGKNPSLVINIQGDEPMLEPENLRILAQVFEEYPDTEMASLVQSVSDASVLEDQNSCFVTLDKDWYALYFSRAALPVVHGIARKEWLDYVPYYKHLGLYAYRPEALQKFAHLPESTLEKAERLEQNRWLENGGKIKLALAKPTGPSVDTPEDLSMVRRLMA